MVFGQVRKQIGKPARFAQFEAEIRGHLETFRSLETQARAKAQHEARIALAKQRLADQRNRSELRFVIRSMLCSGERLLCSKTQQLLWRFLFAPRLLVAAVPSVVAAMLDWPSGSTLASSELAVHIPRGVGTSLISTKKVFLRRSSPNQASADG